MGDRLIYAVRGSTGLFLPRGISKENISNVYEDVKSPKETPCRVFEFSNNGKYFAYCDCSRTVLLEVETGRELLSLPLKRTVAIAFSPRDTYLLLFEPYTVYGQKTEENKPEPNLRVYRTADCSHVTTLVAQKQATWKPQFAGDERIMVRQVGSELLVHKEDALFEKYAFKNSFPKMDNFEISPGSGQYIAIFTPPQGAGTACVQIRRLDPKFTITNTKNFFNGDRAQLIWNSKGTALLIHASVDVDSTNQSYYGASSVHLINVLTGDVCQVSLAKNGPVYAVRWNPNGKEFAVCYGYMPAKVTLFSFRGEPILDMPEGSRNDIHYNAFGNVLLVCGFGNLATGKMEFWDVEKRKEIITIEVPNTTLFQWAPDGRHFLTATTTPRLRIDNNYRLWHYSGKLLHEVTYNSPLEELWQVQFRPVPASAFTEFRVEELTKQQRLQAGLLIKTKHADHPLNNLPAGAIKKVGAYVPPHLRNNANQGALKTGAAPKTVLGETEKKIRNLQKKVDDIVKLKDKQARGEKMELNQVEKISKEAELVAELEALKAS